MTHIDLDDRRSKLTPRLIHRLANAYERKLNESSPSKQSIPSSQKELLIQLELNGTRVSVLAERMGVTKQAVSRTSQVLEKKGYVERVEDASDGRGTIIYFTDRGRKLVKQTVDRFEAIEKDIASQLGIENAKKLNQLLFQWAEHLDSESF